MRKQFSKLATAVALTSGLVFGLLGQSAQAIDTGGDPLIVQCKYYNHGTLFRVTERNTFYCPPEEPPQHQHEGPGKDSYGDCTTVVMTPILQD